MHTQANARRTLGIAVVILIAAAFTGTGIAQTSKGARAAAPAVGMQKVVTEKASFVLYVPKGWKVKESAEGQSLLVTASDPHQLHPGPTGLDLLDGGGHRLPQRQLGHEEHDDGRDLGGQALRLRPLRGEETQVQRADAARRLPGPLGAPYPPMKERPHRVRPAACVIAHREKQVSSVFRVC